jgi:hypothetical protein
MTELEHPVYLASDLKHHRQVAIKVLKPELAADGRGLSFGKEGLPNQSRPECWVTGSNRWNRRKRRPSGDLPEGRRVVSYVVSSMLFAVVFQLPSHDTDAQNTA